MIYIGFLLDYLIMLFLPIDTFFVINDLEENNFLSLIFIGVLLDVIYHKWLFNLLILIAIYFILKIIKIKKKYRFFKNIVVFILYFSILHVMFGINKPYIYTFIISMILQIIYINLSKVLSK